MKVTIYNVIRAILIWVCIGAHYAQSGADTQDKADHGNGNTAVLDPFKEPHEATAKWKVRSRIDVYSVEMLLNDLKSGGHLFDPEAVEAQGGLLVTTNKENMAAILSFLSRNMWAPVDHAANESCRYDGDLLKGYKIEQMYFEFYVMRCSSEADTPLK